MKKLLFTLVTLLVATVPMVAQQPEMTEMPLITWYLTEDYVHVSATGNGVVNLYVDGNHVDNPCELYRDYYDRTFTVYATAQETGKLMSTTEEFVIEVPALIPSEAPQPIITFTEEFQDLLIQIDVEDGYDLFAEITINGELLGDYTGGSHIETTIARETYEQHIVLWAEAYHEGYIPGFVEAEYTLAAQPFSDVPTVSVEITDDAAIITAEGNGAVDLYLNDVPISNPYSIDRTYEEQEFTVWATAKEEGKQMSRTEDIIIVVPAKEMPSLPTPIIITETQDEVVVITAIGEEFVRLYINDVLVSSGQGRCYYTIPRTDEVQHVVATASDSCEGYISSYVSYDIIIEPLEQPYDFEVDGIFYRIMDQGKVSVTRESLDTPCYSGDVTIPATVVHDGVTYKVTSILSKAFLNCVDLTSVTVSGNVTTINTQAFEGCTGLTDVVLGDYVITVEPAAFLNCTSLARLTLGHGVRNIQARAFQGCPAITSIVSKAATPPSIYDMACFDCYETATVTVHPAVIDTYRVNFDWKWFKSFVESETVNPTSGDVNGDGNISVSDITMLINMMLNGH